MRLAEARRRKFLSQRRLAKVAAVGASTIYFIESGRVRPSLDTIRKLVQVLEVDPLEVDEFRGVIQGG